MLNNLSGEQVFIVIISIIIAMSIHEAMHGFAAHWLGDPTAEEAGRLTLNPLKHIDLVTTIILPVVMIITTGIPFFAAKPVPFNPERVKYDEFGTAIVGVAGPLTNLVLAVLAAGIFHLWGTDLGSFFYNFLILFTEVNIGFFIFNMIPFPPLDGSRLLYAFAPEPLQEAMMQIESMGFITVLIFIIIIFQFASGPIVNIENWFVQLLLG
ncbi:MAG TPA: site-2 protease family protein [Candidatus Saccharimonadia bacterium]|nr:site-2 protease family protein [Candidatus Saccharimonadia bacterium]